MHILLLEVEFHLPSAQSLKDKRSIVRSMKDRLRNEWNVSVAETEHHDLWQRCTIAIVTVSNLRQRTEETVAECLAHIESNYDIVVTGANQQWL